MVDYGAQDRITKNIKFKPSSNTLNGAVGIFFMFGGLDRTVVESQVILPCRSMIEKGIHVEIWSFCSTRKAYDEAKRRLLEVNSYGVPISIFRGVRQSLPLSEFINALILCYWLLRYKKNPSFLHCRTEYPTTVAILSKPIIHAKIIWDARGDTESETRLYIKELPTIKRLLSSIKLAQIKFRLMISKKFADYCIFVSDSLRNLYVRDHKQNSAVIPCVADKTVFYFSPELRAETRSKLSFSPNDVVLIYVGSMALWQCIDETIQLITDHLMAKENNKAIILTPDEKTFLSHFSSDFRPRLICQSVSLVDVNKYLNAADFAIFLRENNNINKVASPVKFAEYSLAGLPVIMTEAVVQSFNYAKEFDNLVYSKLGETIEVPKKSNNERRLAISRKATLQLSHDNARETLFRLYKTLQPKSGE